MDERLVSALTDLLTAQNDFLSVWINQEALRRTLDFDMGTMQLDPSGSWIDPGPLVANDPSVTLEASENALEPISPEIGPAAPDAGLQGQGYVPAADGIQPVSWDEPYFHSNSLAAPRRLPPLAIFPVESPGPAGPYWWSDRI